MKTPTDPIMDFLESIDNPAKQFVQEVNELYPGTFPSDEDMLTDHIMGDVDITGLKLSEIQRRFVENGFTKQEIYDLECLQNEHILEKSGIVQTPSFYSEKSNLILYLRAWVEILKEQDAKEQPKAPEIKERIVYVAVPVTITKQVKTLILS